MAFSWRAAPRETFLFLFSGALMALITPIVAFASKLLIDAAFKGQFGRGLVAGLVLALIAGLGLIVVLYYVDLLFSVAEKAGSAVDERLIGLMAGVHGLAHHERPEYLDHLDLLREQRSSLAYMTNATAGIVRVAVQLIATGILLARLHPALLLLPLVGFVSFLAGKKAQDVQQQALETMAETERLRRHIFSTATSAPMAKELRVFGLEDEMITRHHAVAGTAIATRNRAEWQAAGLQTIDALVSGLTYAGAIALVLVRAVKGQATPGDVVLAVGLAAGMNDMVFTAVMYGASFLKVLRVAERLLWLEDYAREAHDISTDPVGLPNRLASGIELQHLSFHYPGTEAGVLDDISLLLPAGSVVALVGENGAGKTTLVKLLCRFYQPDAGSILVDGVDVRRFDVGRWRRRVSAAFQDFARFEFLAGEVVGVGDLPRIENRQALDTALARAGAQDLPERLPAGLQTQLGKDWDGGIDLSGGQWQKLALGRGMMRDQPLLLVLDEPTASLATVLLLSGVMLLYAVWFAIMTCSFWLVQVNNLDVLFFAVFEAARYPLAYFSSAIRALLTFVVPVAFATTFPVEALLGRVDVRLLPLGLGLTAIALALTHLFWNVAVRSYSSASS